MLFLLIDIFMTHKKKFEWVIRITVLEALTVCFFMNVSDLIFIITIQASADSASWSKVNEQSCPIDHYRFLGRKTKDAAIHVVSTWKYNERAKANNSYSIV